MRCVMAQKSEEVKISILRAAGYEKSQGTPRGEFLGSSAIIMIV